MIVNHCAQPRFCRVRKRTSRRLKVGLLEPGRDAPRSSSPSMKQPLHPNCGPPATARRHPFQLPRYSPSTARRKRLQLPVSAPLNHPSPTPQLPAADPPNCPLRMLLSVDNEIETHQLRCMVTIKVALPLKAAQEYIDTLGRFSGIIEETWVQSFCLTSNPRWERVPSACDGTCFRLMTGSTNPAETEVLREDVKSLQKMSIEQFGDRLRIVSFAFARKTGDKSP